MFISHLLLVFFYLPPKSKAWTEFWWTHFAGGRCCFLSVVVVAVTLKDLCGFQQIHVRTAVMAVTLMLFVRRPKARTSARVEQALKEMDDTVKVNSPHRPPSHTYIFNPISTPQIKVNPARIHFKTHRVCFLLCLVRLNSRFQKIVFHWQLNIPWKALFWQQ